MEGVKASMEPGDTNVWGGGGGGGGGEVCGEGEEEERKLTEMKKECLRAVCSNPAPSANKNPLWPRTLAK